MALPSSNSRDISVSINIDSVENKAKEKDLSYYLPLYKAIIAEDWKIVKRFFEHDPNALTAKITRQLNTPLHVAATGSSIRFMGNLVELMTPEELAQPNVSGDTAFHRVAGIGGVEIAKLLFKKNPDLPNMWNHAGRFPLHYAAMWGHKDMVQYLLKITKEDIEPKPFEGHSGSLLMRSLITSELYDMALLVLRRHPNLAVSEPSPLNEIAQNPSAFPSGARFDFLQRFIYMSWPLSFHFYLNIPMKSEIPFNVYDGEDVESPTESPEDSAKVCRWFPWFQGRYFISGLWKVVDFIKQNLVKLLLISNVSPQIKHIRETKLIHHQMLELLRFFCGEIVKLNNNEAVSILVTPFLTAARFGIHEVVEEILVAFPDVIYYADEEGNTILHIAVINRHENVYNLTYQMRYDCQQFLSILTTKGNKSVLHLAGELAPKHRLNIVFGAALQMQRELQWYKEVEKFVPPSHKELKNNEGKTPGMVFTEAHSALMKEGEQWMKDSAGSCIVAATLIATVVFSAAITVPGDYSGNGIPNYWNEPFFIVFAISNAFSFFSSIFSLLMFLSIFTSRYTEFDFLNQLPMRMTVGLINFSLSITSLMIAFSTTLYLVFIKSPTKLWVLIPVATMAFSPVIIFVSRHYPLLEDMIKFTFCPGIFRKQGERILA
ncbi:hypothetical protein Vadar_009130 [Vaccinium darrowii]|uniref:Uncharacterized protein n=1 Tax=Vaccinium darrowii TaxID=229202 RepID=A0ACB7ZAA6_9ERIC|nr:hypothetical protein Vadar_009130 [Vaccinium darrowii]